MQSHILIYQLSNNIKDYINIFFKAIVGILSEYIRYNHAIKLTKDV